MYDFEIAEHFYELAALLKELQGSPYRERAFFRAALALDAYGTDIQEAHLAGTLQPFRHVGKGVLAKIDELLNTGSIQELQDLRLAARRARELSGKQNAAAKQQTFLESASSDDDLYNPRIRIMQCAHAEAIAHDIAASLNAEASIQHVEVVGDVRCQREVVFEIELLVIGRSNTDEVVNVAKSNRFVDGIKSATSSYISATLHNGCLLTIEFCVVSESATRTLFASSTPDHLEWLQAQAQHQGLLLCLTGLRDTAGNTIEVQTEEDIYNRLAIPYVAAPLRQGSGSCHLHNYAAMRNILDVSDIRGDLHVHSEWSDGLDSLEAISCAGKQVGHEYILIADHTAHLRLIKGLDVQRSQAQMKQIEHVNQTNQGCRLLRGIEVDILPDGSLDFPSSFLESFDVVVGAIHSSMRGSPAKMMARLERALSTGAIDILAHPTGRLLGRPGEPQNRRPPYIRDIETLCHLCQQHRVALEINCFPERMDLCANHVAMAIEKGVMVSIGTDSHSIRHLSLIKYGISTARRAWSPASSILNTLTAKKLIKWARDRRLAARPHVQSPPKSVARLSLRPYMQPQTMAKLRKKLRAGNCSEVTAVGIDLSGSTRSRTGWASLSGTRAHIERVSTDEDIIAATLDAKPGVVSIDSPLGLPHGRCCCDPSCECARFGITREAERVLMRMGIGVFPSLLPSMVPLTTRGIRIADALRARGLTVIESFPGAAQDMLGIYRKKAGIALLEKGLLAFGVELPNDDLTHDDLDGVTSALVGCYWLADQFLAIGEESESTIIVPKVPRYTEPSGQCVTIGLSGLTAAGKTTVATYLAFKYGIRYIRYSLLLKEILKERGLTPNKRALQDLGLEIHEKMGPEGFTRKLLSHMSRNEHWVVDGLRYLGDDRTLREMYGDDFLHLHVRANPKTREKRFTHRESTYSKGSTLFSEVDSHPVEAGASALGNVADVTVPNNASFKALFRQIDTLLVSLQDLTTQ